MRRHMRCATNAHAHPSHAQTETHTGQRATKRDQQQQQQQTKQKRTVDVVNERRRADEKLVEVAARRLVGRRALVVGVVLLGVGPSRTATTSVAIVVVIIAVATAIAIVVVCMSRLRRRRARRRRRTAAVAATASLATGGVSGRSWQRRRKIQIHDYNSMDLAMVGFCVFLWWRVHSRQHLGFELLRFEEFRSTLVSVPYLTWVEVGG